jgi:hypothetical protein
MWRRGVVRGWGGLRGMESDVGKESVGLGVWQGNQKTMQYTALYSTVPHYHSTPLHITPHHTALYSTALYLHEVYSPLKCKDLCLL